MNEVFKSVEILDESFLRTLNIVKVERNIFTINDGCPSDTIDLKCLNDFKFSGCNNEVNVEDDEEYHEYLKELKKLRQSKKKLRKELQYNVKYVVAKIYYPVYRPAIFKFDCSSVKLTYGKLLTLYTYAYQLMYKLEDDDVGELADHIPGMLNRCRSNGRFEIWGHDIYDLVYNTLSTLEYTNDTVICEFGVSS